MQPRPDDLGADVAPNGAAASDTSPRRGPGIGTVVVLSVIALQIAVPTIALLLPPPQRFGFQMYSGLGGVTVSVVDAEGVESDYEDAEQLVAKLRPDLDWLPTLPESVCEAVPEATRVRVEQSSRERTLECD